jgi:hypothetical protein
MRCVRLFSLLVLACVLCVCALQARGATPSPSPTPSTEEKRPNVVRRFFGWTIGQITRPFRREQLIVCSLPPFVDISASKSSITFCPTTGQVSTLSCSPDRKVELVARAIDDNQFLFTWAVTGGTISGEGRQVIWDLSSVPEGTYTATLEMKDQSQHAVSVSTTVTVALCSGCERPPPLCPTVSVSCPTDLAAKEIPFEAFVQGGEPGMQPTFTWTITAGKIISGQGTSKIVVDSSGLNGRSITATVSLGGADPACAVQQASCTILH